MDNESDKEDGQPSSLKFTDALRKKNRFASPKNHKSRHSLSYTEGEHPPILTHPAVNHRDEIKVGKVDKPFIDGVIAEKKGHYILVNRSDPDGNGKRLDLIMLNPDKDSPIRAVEFHMDKYTEADHGVGDFINKALLNRLDTRWRVFPNPRNTAEDEAHMVQTHVIKKEFFAEPLGYEAFINANKLGDITLDIDAPLEQFVKDGKLSKPAFEKMDDAIHELINIVKETNVMEANLATQKNLLNPVLKILDKGLGATRTA